MSDTVTDKSKLKTTKLEPSPAIQKQKLLNTEITKEQAELLDNIPIPEEFKNKYLYCHLWNERATRTIAKPKKIKYGQPYFTAKVGGKDRYFKINYNTEGMIQNIEGKLYYHTAFDNSVGGFALRNYEFPEDMDSEEAYTIFKNNAVNMYVKKGGIPLIYLMVAMGVALVAFIAIIAVIPDGLHAKDQVKDLDNQITALRAQNQILQQEITRLSNSNSGGVNQ